jgi:CheY-like chemotaxis protein
MSRMDHNGDSATPAQKCAVMRSFVGQLEATPCVAPDAPEPDGADAVSNVASDAWLQRIGGRQRAACSPARPTQPVHPAAGSNAAAPVPAPPRELRVLIAEDNKVNQLVVKKVLRRMLPKCDVEFAEDGEAALQAVRMRPPFDLILMDLHMPRMDGLEAAQRIRALHGGSCAVGAARPRIVALTADTLAGVRARCTAAGMDDYVAKPFHVEDMQRILRGMVPAAA